jgi:hypothetical protein
MFDDLVEVHKVEKITTIGMQCIQSIAFYFLIVAWISGDAYVVASGVPNPCENHVEVMIEYAIAMLEAGTPTNENVSFSFLTTVMS